MGIRGWQLTQKQKAGIALIFVSVMIFSGVGVSAFQALSQWAPPQQSQPHTVLTDTVASGATTDEWYTHTSHWSYENGGSSASNEKTTTSFTGYPAPSYPSYPGTSGTSYSLTWDGYTLASGTSGTTGVSHSQSYTHNTVTLDGRTEYETLAYSDTSWSYIATPSYTWSQYGSSGGTSAGWTLSLDGGSQTGTIVLYTASAAAPSGPTSVDQDQTASYTASASGSNFGISSYQWYVNGAAVSGATGSSFSYQFTSASSTYSLSYHALDSSGYDLVSPTTSVSTTSSPLSVSISSSKNPSDTGQSVVFTASASGGSGSYTNYNFYLNGGSVQSGGSNQLTETFSSTGSDTVYVVVTDSNSNTATSSTITQTVNSDPSVSVSSSQSPTDIGHTVTFTASVSGGTSSFAYQWYVSGSAVSGATSSTYSTSFSSAGTYDVGVTVTDAAGYSVSYSSDYSAESVASSPTVTASDNLTSASPANQADVGFPIEFSSSPSGGVGGYTYSWVINGNQVSTAQDFSYSFGTAGSYTVTVTVTDGDGLTASASVTVTINANPSVTASSSQDPTDAGNSVTFSISETGGTGSLSYAWSITGPQDYSSSGTPYTLTFSSQGTYTVTVTVTDAEGHSATSSITETVNADPSVTISSSENPIDAGASATFTATGSGGTSSYNYTWSYGGGTVGYGSTYTRSFSSSGSYVVDVQVRDGAGNTATASFTETVNSDPSVSVSSSQNPTDVGNTVTFTATPSGGTSPYTYQWYENGGAVNGATASTFSTSFSSAGNASIYVVLTDGVGKTYQSSAITETVSAKPSVSIGSSQNATDVGNSVTFSAVIAGGNSPYSYSWYVNGVFENVSSSSYSRTFSSAGLYEIQVDIKDTDGNTAVGTYYEQVNPDPSVGITSKQNPTDQGKSVELIANPLNGTGPYTYQWTISGNTFSGQYLNYTFTSSGTIPIYLTLTDASGNTASATLNEVVNPQPSVSIYAEYLTLDAYVNDTFTATISGGTAPYSYNWTLGGSTISTSESFTMNFTSPGTYTLRVEISDSLGEVANQTISITVKPRANASISGPIQIDVNTQGAYTADLNTSIGYYSVVWIVGGVEQSSTAGTLLHTFSSTGTIIVTLQATGHSGASNATASITVTVDSGMKVAINSSGPSQVDLGYGMHFNASVQFGTGPFSYVWAVDGQEISQQASAAYQFNAYGINEVELTVTDQSGNRANAYLNVSVSQDPTVRITLGSQYIDPGVSDYLNATVQYGIGSYNYTWEINNQTTYGQSTIASFQTPGTYLVTVTLRDNLGVTASSSAYIYVEPLPQAFIKLSSSVSDIGEKITLTGSASGGVQPYNYTWLVSGSVVGFGTTDSYTFGETGVYQVELVVTDSFGTESVAYANETVVSAVSASFTSHSIDLGQAETLISNVSGGSGPFHYEWIVNGLPYGSSANFTFQFFAAGTYSVELVVTDSAGRNATASEAIVISPDPTATINENYSTVDPEIPDTFVVSVQNGTPGFTFAWYLNGSLVSSTAELNYTFPVAGEYKIEAKVTDAADFTTEQSVTATVRGNPNVLIEKPLSKKDAHVPITFNPILSGGVGPYNYEWLIGEKTYNVSSPTVTFTSPGNYTVQLTVSDSFGRDAINDSYIVIYSDPTDTLLSTGSPVVSLPYELSLNITGGVGPYKVQWLFPSGQQETGNNISHTFASSGPDTFQAQVTDATGYVISSNFTLQVNLYVVADANGTSGLGPISVQFSSAALGGTGYAYNWSFGDGTGSLLENPVHTFQVGNYTVNVTITSDNGAQGYRTFQIVSLPPPVVFSYTPETNITTLTPVQFTAVPSWDAGSGYSVSWLFPNGQTLSGLSTNYTFPEYQARNNVTATFTYDGGKEYRQTLTVAMLPTPVTLKWDVQNIIEVGRIVNVSASATSLEAATYTYEWSIAGQVYYGPDQILLFNNPGNYSVSVTAISSLGVSKTLSTTVAAEVAGTSSSIVLHISENSRGPITTYSVQVVSPYSIEAVQAYMGQQEFNLSLSNQTNGDWYNLTLNQGQYVIGTYTINFIAFAANGQSNSATSSFKVASAYGIQTTSIFSYFGGEFNFLITVFVVITAVGLLIMIAVWHKHRNTEYLNVGGEIELQGLKTPLFRRQRKMATDKAIEKDIGIDRLEGNNGFGGGGFS